LFGYAGGIEVGGYSSVPANSSVTAIRCTIADNSAVSYQGGGVFCYLDSAATLVDCAITGNTSARSGGGLCAYDCSLFMTGCRIADNVSAEGGGGIFCDGESPVAFVNCTIAGNSAGANGGGIRCRGNATIVNCLFVDNLAANAGGGLHCSNGQPVISNCTFSGNEAPLGGGLRCREVNATLANTVLWADTAPDGPEIALAESSVLTVAYCDAQAGEGAIYLEDDSSTVVWGSGNIDADPLFVDPDGPDNDPNTWQDNNYRLTSGSPCVDAGSNWLVPPDVADLDDDGDTTEYTPLDLDGEGRFFDDPNTPDTGCGVPPIVDMGPYELGGTGPQPCFGDLDGNRIVDMQDLFVLLEHYGGTGGATGAEGDMDCNGAVALDDLAALLGAYGSTCD
jgi:predicted outer membrane repeat protein